MTVTNIFFFSYLFTDEPKLNSGSWEDPLPLPNSTVTPPPSTAINSTNRRSDTLARHSLTNNHLTAYNNHSNCNSTRRRLEHTPSARTISSEESWCSEGPNSERELSSDEDDDDLSDRSISSSNARNSQLRSTFNKAKHHLSFDKWRNNNKNSGEGTAIMPIQQQQQNQELNTPGESPGGRLSRWFSIRRGSAHQYDVGGRNSLDGSDEQIQLQIPQPQTPRVPSGTKMPQLCEVSFSLKKQNGGFFFNCYSLFVD